MTKKLPSARLLRRLIDYDPETGEMWWKERPVWMFSGIGLKRLGNSKKWNTRYAGTLALNSPHSAGYKEGRVFKHRILAHRVAWTIFHGDWPGDEIDHINGARADNHIANLRSVDHHENMRNMRKSKANKSGVTGVFWSSARGVWQATIRVGGRDKTLGFFTDIRAAERVRLTAQKKYGFHPNHGRA